MNIRLSRTEFVTLMAGLTALEALAIDIMLPAFPEIGASLQIVDANDRSLILTAFLVGFGPMQVLFGPLADRFGRRRIILAGLLGYVLSSFACATGGSLATMLVARALQGAAAAAVKVAVTAAIRDRFVGQAMVETLSLVAAVFLIVPIVCPAIGQGLLMLGSWRLIFVFIGLVGFGLLLWSGFRLPESLREEARRSLSIAALTRGFREVVGHRSALLYGTVGAFMYGIIANLLNTSQQVYVEVFGLGRWFPIAFAFTTIVASISSLFMSRITRALGMRRTAHAAAFIIAATSGGFACSSMLHPPTLWSFYIMLLFVFPAVVATFTTTMSLSLEPHENGAGTAASIFGAITMVGGASIGAVTAQLYDGTVVPILWSNCLMGVCAIACYLAAERGQLFALDTSSQLDAVAARGS